MTNPARVCSPGRRFRIARQKAVSWFDTRQLLATGSRALAASIVGSMSGRREIMAALEPDQPTSIDCSGHEELWIDYVADTGDGWNATASIAWLAGRDGLVLDDDGQATAQPIPDDCYTEAALSPGADQRLLPAGKILILGGDQIYPTASPEAYQQRFIDPFRCARWYAEPGRRLFAIPGNHDWYDGLTSFIRLFCQSEPSRRWIGCWQAQQRRSYFAIQLPHRWWLWGIDMALEDDLDPPQYDYFRAQAARLRPGDQVILVVPAPTWLKSEAAEARRGSDRDFAGDKLGLIMELMREANVDVPLLITGDLHYYTRHSAPLQNGERHYVVCGGGGAFGLGTLQVPPKIVVPEHDGQPCEAGVQKAFPDRDESTLLRRKVLLFPFKNPAFTASLVLIQAISLWLLSSARSGWIARLIEPQLDLANLGALMADAALTAFTSPGLLLWISVLLLGFGAFAKSGSPPGGQPWLAWVWGASHGLLQIAGSFVCIWLAAQAIGYTLQSRPVLAPPAPPATAVAGQWATLVASGAISYFYCGLLFALNLLLGHKLLGLHDQEVFSAQGIEGYKSFLRFRISAEGAHLYAIGLRQHASEWKAAPGVDVETIRSGIFSKVQEVVVPAGAQRAVDPCEPLQPHLIEPPIFIPRPKREVC